MTEQKLERCLPWLRALAEGGSDPVVRSLFADWLNEHDLADEAKGQRWAAQNGKRPTAWGWWVNRPAAADHNELPLAFWDEGPDSLHNDDLHSVQMRNYLHYERVYLLRCGEMLWGDGGEPLARYKPAAEVATRPQS